MRKSKTRGNGTGTVYQLPNKTWRAEVTLGYTEDDYKKRSKRTKQGFKTKKEALEYLPTLRGSAKKEKKITFKALYDKWLPTHDADKSTINCYKAAYKHFEPLWFMKIQDVDVDDLQECIDESNMGKQTRRNMKTLCGLMYKYGIPRNLVPDKLNLADYLKVTGEYGPSKRALTDIEVEKIRLACGKVEYADYIYCMIYTGFRLGEFLALDIADYNREERYVTGGSKTEAGKNRDVTISPKIQPIIDGLIGGRTSGPIFVNKATKRAFSVSGFREDCYYPTLEAAGICSPKENRLTPHTCRRTFATLMKRVTAADSKDKLELIGHTSEEMLRYYQDTSIEDLRQITDAI